MSSASYIGSRTGRTLSKAVQKDEFGYPCRENGTNNNLDESSGCQRRADTELVTRGNLEPVKIMSLTLKEGMNETA